MRGRWTGVTTAGAVTGAAALLLPEVLRLDRTPPWPIVIAFRRRLAVGTLAAALPLAARPGAARVPALGVAVVAAGAVGLSGWRHRARRTPALVGTRELSVLGANVWLGRADPAALAATIVAEQPDVVVLPEAGDRFRKRLLDGLDGYRAWSCAPYRAGVEASGAEDGPCLTVLVATGLGDVDVAPASRTPAPGGSWSAGAGSARCGCWACTPRSCSPPPPRTGPAGAPPAAAVAGRPVAAHRRRRRPQRDPRARAAAARPGVGPPGDAPDGGDVAVVVAARGRRDHRPRARRGAGRGAFGRGARRRGQRPPCGARPAGGLRATAFPRPGRGGPSCAARTSAHPVVPGRRARRRLHPHRRRRIGDDVGHR